MIDKEQLPAYIQESIPELDIVKQDNSSVYEVVKRLLNYTSTQVAKHNMGAAKQCLTLAAQLHKKGNNSIKNAIENVYVYSFSHAFFHNDHQRREVLEIVPPSLYEIYRSQLVNSHL